MKHFRLNSFRLLISCLLILGLFGELHARLFVSTNNGFLCRWSQKRICLKKKPICVRVTTTDGTASTSTCTYYINQCQYLIDRCLGQTTSGDVVASTVCTSNGITPGQADKTCT